MLELVLHPTTGQFAVHTPFLMKKGRDIYLFYGRCDYPPNGQTTHFRKNYSICYAVGQDGVNFVPNPTPIIDKAPSTCRPWIVEQGSEYRMYFVYELPYPDAPIRFRIYTAVSRDLETWAVEEDSIIPEFDRLEHIASPFAFKQGRKVRMYFSAAKRGGMKDCIYRAESSDGIHFKRDPNAIYEPSPGTGYSESCYTPAVYRNGSSWKMLFSGCDDSNKYRTFIAESRDGTNFSAGKILIDLSDDPRFVNGAYKAVKFEEHLYFVGTDHDGRSSIYRMPYSE